MRCAAVRSTFASGWLRRVMAVGNMSIHTAVRAARQLFNLLAWHMLLCGLQPSIARAACRNPALLARLQRHPLAWTVDSTGVMGCSPPKHGLHVAAPLLKAKLQGILYRSTCRQRKFCHPPCRAFQSARAWFQFCGSLSRQLPLVSSQLPAVAVNCCWVLCCGTS